MTDEAFRLSSDPPKPKRATFENDPCRQTVLFTGLDCLPGQQDLFHVDGQAEKLQRDSA